MWANKHMAVKHTIYNTNIIYTVLCGLEIYEM